MINHLITVMTSRHPREALKPNSSSTTALSGFLEYLGSWEQHAEKDGGGGVLEPVNCDWPACHDIKHS
ncbi:hypothetical protein HPB48_019815 [Haemaphysalis longicornis]|uniref:Uncharacterized protein n=1 Tax=Haemaphysalis longicornis TaxID=44386 RepID=A0A9J6FCA1_HAELO|nr:hypothetical protein HPB48_019815 [Haemaphysalis longicornis]